MTYKQIYDDLLSYCKIFGIKVRHVSMSLQYYGDYDCTTNLIHINNKIKSYKVRCITLAHEIAHALDFIFGNFPRFFKSLGKYSKKKLQLVVDAECSASIHATQMLKYYGKTKVFFEELDPELLEKYLIPVWKKIYFSH